MLSLGAVANVDPYGADYLPVGHFLRTWSTIGCIAIDSTFHFDGLATQAVIPWRKEPALRRTNWASGGVPPRPSSV